MKILYLTKDIDNLRNTSTGTVKAIGRFMEELGHEVVYWHTRPGFINFKEFDLAVSFLYRHRLYKVHLDGPKYGCINMHPSYLPYGRGSCPNVWAIYEGTKAGTTIHWMDEEFDTGNILAQKEVSYEEHTGGEQLYYYLMDASRELFQEFFPDFVESLEMGATPLGMKQPHFDTLPMHTMEQFHQLRDLDLMIGDDQDKAMIMEVFDIIRACTFKGFPGAYITLRDGKKYQVQLYFKELRERNAD